MLIKLKCYIGDRFAFNTSTPFRTIPLSSIREEVTNRTDSFRKQVVLKDQEFFNSNIFIIPNNLVDNTPVR